MSIRMSLTLAVWIGVSTATATGQPWFVSLADDSHPSPLPMALSADGRCVVGSSDGEAFSWTKAAGFVDLGIPPSYLSTEALAVSSDGTTVVGRMLDIQYHAEAYRWTESEGISGLGKLPGADSSVATGVSGDGRVIVGASNQEAFVWTEEEGMQGLGFLPGSASSMARAVSTEGSVIVGESGGEAFIWTAQSGMVGLGYLPGDVSSRAIDVSPAGAVVVGSSDNEAFRWDAENGFDGLGAIGGALSRAAAVSDDETSIVGASSRFFGDDSTAAFLWTKADGMREVRTVLLEAGVDEVELWDLRDARGVSANGAVVLGYGGIPGLGFSAWIASLPAACYPDLTGDGALDLFDFLTFVNAFNVNDPLADCVADGVFDLFDFLCFVNAFNTGC